MRELPQVIPERLPDLPEPCRGFLSYARRDDLHEQGRITTLRNQIQGEFEFQTGIKLEIFQDTDGLRGGDPWRGRIADAISSAQVFLPIITPSYFRSGPCREELERYYSDNTDSRNRIIPIRYVDLPEWVTQDDPLVALLNEYHQIDFSAARFFEHGTADYRSTIAELVQHVVKGLDNVGEVSSIAEYEPLAGVSVICARSVPGVGVERENELVDRAVRPVHIVQNAVGFVHGQLVQYRLGSSDGIELVSDPIPLREGRYNISAAFRGSEQDSDGSYYLPFAVRDNQGTARTLRLEVLGLPDHCVTDRRVRSIDLLQDGDAEGRVTLEATISCDSLWPSS